MSSTTAGPFDGRARRALLIGIDEYPRFRGANLNGAVEDVLSMEALLQERFDFGSSRIEVLTNEKATRDGIIAALSRLLNRTGEGDVVVVQFCGHGSRRQALDHPRRISNWENVLVPCDSSHGDAVVLGPELNQAGDSAELANRDIAGREIYAWLRHLATKTPRITLILDCCHAAALPRTEDEFATVPIRTVNADTRSKRETLPFPWSIDDPELPRPGDSEWLADGKTHTLIAACRANELAREVIVRKAGGDLYHGALTYALLDLLGKTDGATYDQLLPGLIARVTGRYVDQHPSVEGAVRRRLFSVREGRQRRDVLVTANSSGRVVLGAGAIQGIDLGSRWGIYPPEVESGVEAPPKTEPPEAEVRIGAVRGARSDATVIDPVAASVIGPGWRARRLSFGLDVQLPSVAVVGPRGTNSWRAEMVREIDECPALQTTVTEDEADFVVAAVEPRSRPMPADQAAGLGPLPEPCCLLLNRQGQLLAPPRPLHDDEAAAVTRDNLERWARWQRFLELENPEPTSIHGRVEFELRRRAENESWVPARAKSDGCFRYQDGDRFAIALRNRGERKVYVYLFDLGMRGWIQPLVPIEGAHERLPGGGEEVVFGEDDWWFGIPPTLPYEAPGAHPWVGKQHLKLLVTDRPGDFANLIQGAARSGLCLNGDGETSSLVEHLALIGGATSREVMQSRHPSSVAWSTETISVELRRS